MNRLSEILTERGMSMSELARKAFRSPGAVAGIARGEYKPSMVMRACLANALDLPESAIWPPDPPAKPAANGSGHAGALSGAAWRTEPLNEVDICAMLAGDVLDIRFFDGTICTYVIGKFNSETKVISYASCPYVYPAHTFVNNWDATRRWRVRTNIN